MQSACQESKSEREGKENESLEKYILAIITTNPSKVSGGTAIFNCETKDEMD